MVKNDAEKLVKAFGTGFILKKNLNSVMTANVGEEWVEAVRRLEAASPRHFAATFSETYSRLYSANRFYQYAKDDLVLFLQSDSWRVCCDPKRAASGGAMKRPQDKRGSFRLPDGERGGSRLFRLRN